MAKINFTTTKFRKKPVVIDAVLVGGGESPDWWKLAFKTGKISGRPVGVTPKYYIVKTLEGNMRANYGDWIVRGVKGELYPVKDDIFRATYEPVENA